MSNNSLLLKHIFQLDAEDNQNRNLSRLLKDTIEEIKAVTKDTLEVNFNNGIKTIINYNFDMFHLYISDHRFYQNDETAFTPMSKDRILFYLNDIANFKYERILRRST